MLFTLRFIFLIACIIMGALSAWFSFYAYSIAPKKINRAWLYNFILSIVVIILACIAF